MMLLWSMAFLSSASVEKVSGVHESLNCNMRQHTKLGIGVGGFRIDRVLDCLVVALDGNLALAGTALVLVVLEVAGGDVLSAHGCVVM